MSDFLNQKTDKISIGERIRSLREKLTQKEFGDKVGVTQSSIQNYESGASFPRGDVLQRISLEFGVDINWLLTGRGDPYLPNVTSKPLVPPPEGTEDHTYIYKEPWEEDIEIPKSKNPPDYSFFHLVPMAEAHLSAGGGAFVLTEDMQEDYAFRRDWLRRVSTSIDNLVLMMVRGASMEPTILPNDIVLIDKGRKRIYEGLIYALGLGETIVIKRLALLPRGRALIYSDNRTEFQPEEALLNDVRVIGQIIWFGRQLVKGEE